MMQGFLVYVLILCGALWESNIVKSAPTTSNTTFDVTNFGAVGDGETDDTKAFESAWTAACSGSSENPNVTVPSGRAFLVSPIKFEGPCKSTFITFEISNLHITAAATSPNTDGIDISSSSNLRIQDCVMETGDDCIAINGGTSSLYISRITCGPGHGISVGSLGKDGSHEEVEGIQVDNCTFIKSQNGVRSKTWPGGSGFAKNITFSNISFVSAGNPVIIDQFYCPGQNCGDNASAVEISEVRYIGLQGTSDSKNGIINLNCSQIVPCTGILFDGLDIIDVGGASSTPSRCINAHGTSDHLSNPAVDCLQP